MIENDLSQHRVNNPQVVSYKQEQPLMVRFFAGFFSYVFHPLFIPFYVIWFLVIFHPSYFSGFSSFLKTRILLITALNTVFFPVFAILLMKGLGFIKSVFLHTQQDRIGPYLSSMIFYFWAARIFFKFEPQINPVLASFMTGVFLTTVAGLLSNIYFKISMHAMGCGGIQVDEHLRTEQRSLVEVFRRKPAFALPLDGRLVILPAAIGASRRAGALLCRLQSIGAGQSKAHR